MKRRVLELGFGLAGAAIVLAIVGWVTTQLAFPPRWPADAVFVPRDVPTLRQAVDEALPGATVVLQAADGPFAGPVVIKTANLTIDAVGGSARLDGMGEEPALTIRADGAVVRNLIVVAESVGLRVEGSECRLEHLVIRETPIGIQALGARSSVFDDLEVHAGRTGLELVSSDGNRLARIVASGFTEAAVDVVRSSRNQFHEIAATDAAVGISLQQGSTGNELSCFRIERSSVVGVEVRGSIDNVLRDGVIEEARIGVVFEAGVGNELSGCIVRSSAVTGVSLRQAVGNRVVENTIERTEGVGVSLFQSAESSVSFNRIVRCGDAGIRLERSDRNLVMRNDLQDNAVGIDGRQSSDCRILRNTVVGSERAGLVFANGAANRFLDNRVIDGRLGVVLSESRGNTLLRNWIEGQRQTGLSVLNGSQENVVAENRISECAVGIWIVSSARNDLIDNVLSRNGIGLCLCHPGITVRVEGNTLERNTVGLKQEDVVGERNAGFEALGIDVQEDGAKPAAPIVVNNTFARNERFDIWNESDVPLYAGGNWWGEIEEGRESGVAVVSEGVRLQESAWKGAIALGTDGSTSQVLLGRILQVVLEGAGFRIIDLVGLGTDVRLREALRVHDVDLIWLKTSDSLRELEPGRNDEIEVTSIPATRGWVPVVSRELADRLEERSVSSLAVLVSETGETLRYTALRTFNEDAFEVFASEYGLESWVGAIQWAETLEESEALLKLGAADVAIVENLEETLSSSDFVVLEDDRRAFESADISVILRREVIDRFPEIADMVSDLCPRLTEDVLHGLVSRVRLLHQAPAVVARDYLRSEGLLAE